MATESGQRAGTLLVRFMVPRKAVYGIMTECMNRRLEPEYTGSCIGPVEEGVLSTWIACCRNR